MDWNNYSFKKMNGQPSLTPEFSKKNLEQLFDVLASVDEDLKIHFNSYLQTEYGSRLPDFELSEDRTANDIDEPDGRLAFLEIAEIARYIVEKFRSKHTNSFPTFFYKVEEILHNCDDYVSDLIVTGLLEGIQNISGREIDYYFGYNQWLPPVVQLKWDSLIDMWEGTGWRNRKY